MNLSGSHLDFLWAFFGGVLVSFTPCVYSLLPVTIGYIGANSAGSRFKGFIMSLIYVTGIAVTYASLGLFASLSGEIFGRISSSGITYIIVGSVIVLFGLSMFGFFDLTLMNFIKPRHIKKENYFSVFVLGLASGLVIGPCLTPALASILAILIPKKNVLYGMLLLFSFAYGMGFTLILAGALSGFMMSLPKLGEWLIYIKKVGAIIILFMGIYFIYSGIGRL